MISAAKKIVRTIRYIIRHAYSYNTRGLFITLARIYRTYLLFTTIKRVNDFKRAYRRDTRLKPQIEFISERKHGRTNIFLYT